ncbi:putative hemerythrin-like protein C869,06c [Talaromyces islandicus]|uniref:Putative hemerythrin-like protein C869,06c n=1 Tax=Talaromyces islandicus TaxID=28573 RepID=A0A0U1MA67_TALIS|nr:putative hemerythrin-like protein C869,06c [Talaromyces islandicus]
MLSITKAVGRDHRNLEANCHTIVKSGDRDERTRFQNELTWELARHSVAEELILCPAFERHLGDGPAVANKVREQHQGIKNKLKTFQSLKQSDPEFNSLLNSLMKDFENHIEEEETSDLPKLENALAAAESQMLAHDFERTKMFVPSRSHPASPSKPPFETVAGLLTVPIDRLGDIFRKFPRETRTPNPSAQGSRA